MILPIFAKLREAVGVVSTVGVPVPVWCCLRARGARMRSRTRQAGTAHIVLATLGYSLAQPLVPRSKAAKPCRFSVASPAQPCRLSWDLWWFIYGFMDDLWMIHDDLSWIVFSLIIVVGADPMKISYRVQLHAGVWPSWRGMTTPFMGKKKWFDHGTHTVWLFNIAVENPYHKWRF
jgi:hypothetical protein